MLTVSADWSNNQPIRAVKAGVRIEPYFLNPGPAALFVLPLVIMLSKLQLVASQRLKVMIIMGVSCQKSPVNTVRRWEQTFKSGMVDLIRLQSFSSLRWLFLSHQIC